MKPLPTGVLAFLLWTVPGSNMLGGNDGMDTIAAAYVRLALAVGQHDADYVDAYYGPPEWKAALQTEKSPLANIRAAAELLARQLASVPDPSEPMLRLRREYLRKQLSSLIARVDMLAGIKLTFDEEAKALYDVDPPQYPENHFRRLLAKLDGMLPGTGSVAQRYRQYRNAFIIPADKLDAVFTAAIGEARRRTREHIALPQDESFAVEYVRDKSWTAYNWYKGTYRSVIQVNTDLPVFIDYAVDLACHEGYPGHHVYNVLLERNLMRARNWIEFSVYPLFSPQSLIAEGTANYGIEVAFPGAERVEFERRVLFPLAGLDPAAAGKYYAIAGLVADLNFVRNEVARGYLNGAMNSETALRWLETYMLATPERARQSLRFIEQYRSYVINYNYGLALVRNFIESRGGTAQTPEARWKQFEALIASPRLPSGLR